MRDFPVSSTQQMQVILEAVPDATAEERSVLEITPTHARSSFTPAFCLLASLRSGALFPPLVRAIRRTDGCW